MVNTKKTYVLITILVLLLTALIYLDDNLSSNLPGWHTTIFLPYYSWVVVTITILFFAVLGYLFYLKRISKLNWTLFMLYVLVSLATYFFVKFPAIFITYPTNDQEKLYKTIHVIMQLFPIAYRAFIITQILFVGYIVIVALLILRKKQKNEYLNT